MAETTPITVAIDAGHGGSDSGAVYNNRKEKDDVLKLAKAVGRILENNGINVYYVRNDDEYETPFKKATDANNIGADYFISIHRNSSERPNQYSGVETLVYNDEGVRARLARNINEQLESTGYKNLGVDERPNLVVLKRSKMPAALVEVGFINNDNDNKIFDENFNDIAQAIADGILATVRGGTRQANTDNIHSIETVEVVNNNDEMEYMDNFTDDYDSNNMSGRQNERMRDEFSPEEMERRRNMMNPDMNGTMQNPMGNNMSGNMGNNMSGSMPNNMSGSMPNNMTGSMPNNMTGSMPNNMTGSMPNNMTGSMPNNMSGSMPNSMSDNMPMNNDRDRSGWEFNPYNDGDTGEKLYRVQVGAYRNKESADRLLNSLLIEGFPAFIVYDDGIYKVQVGAFRFLANAIKMEERLRRFRYNTYITV